MTALGLAWATAPAAAQTTGASGASIVLVLDGSNSMNGRIGADPTPKHVLVREGLRQALPKLPPATRFGLVTFGHRRSADCTDSELVMPPGPVNPVGTLDILERLPPRGYSPAMLGLRQAAKALESAPAPASIVLVLDDLASCREDPCAVAGEIAAAYPNLPIHLVGLALKPEDAQQLTCLPARTGGRLYAANDAAGVATAVEQVLAFAGVDRLPAQPKVPPPMPAARGPQPAATAPGLTLAATLIEKGPPLDHPIRWRITGEGGKADPMEVHAARADLDLAPGRYAVEAQAGLARATRQVEVTPKGRSRIAIPLDAGSLALTASLQKGGRPVPEAMLSVFAVEAGRASSPPLWVSRPSARDIILPAGNYRVVAEEGSVRAERPVSVRAGERTALEVPLGAGRLEVEATPLRAPGGRQQTLYIVHEDDPESPGGRREVARSAAPRAHFTLPPGTYHVTARQGMAEVRERIVLRHGDEVKKTLAIGVARLQLATRITGATATTSEQVSYRVLRLDGGLREVVRTRAAEPILELSPGQYRLESRLGSQNAVAVRDIDLRAGTEQRIVLEQPAGFVRL
ncbi:MAG TPA: VWA domain-containing protein, partial [Hyphomicrobiaceae bacterium]|nr:VWA domain-containing protein [Hyphomicrobiaceae bacterium]